MFTMICFILKYFVSELLPFFKSERFNDRTFVFSRKNHLFFIIILNIL